ncbi:MAG: DegQ family serine endoprotease [Arenicellales bacterium]|nr:DegQ family serine endoprotease [Arenicellales bacterium]
MVSLVTFSRFAATSICVLAFLCIQVNAYGLNRDELPDFAELVATNAPAVVNISTTQTTRRSLPRNLDIPDLPEDSPFHDFFRRFLEDETQPRDARSLGSGFVISPDGYILTSAHVIADANEIIVRFNDRRELVAEVVGADKRSDVALLKVDANDLPIVAIGDPRSLNVGEWVLAIGSPFGFESSATAGIVSAKGRSLPNENYVPFIQTDVAINPGNSGGPLFNLNGEVVGINAQIYSRTGGFMGLSFAVPIDIAMRVTTQLKLEGKVTRGWLGVLIQNVTRDLAESFGMSKPAGALVSEILENSPAADSDLKPGDIIVKYDGTQLDKMSDLPPLVGVTPVDKAVKLEVIRQGKTIDIEVTIGELPGDNELLAGLERPGEAEALGMTVEDLSDEQRNDLQVEHGVLVTKIVTGPAQRAGILEQDIILQIQGTSVTDTATFLEIIEKLPDKSVPVLIKRDSRSTFLALRKE